MDPTPVIKMIFDFVAKLVPAKTGTKFLTGLSGMLAIVYLAAKEIGTSTHVYAIGGIIVIYFLADLISKFLSKTPELPLEEKDNDLEVT